MLTPQALAAALGLPRPTDEQAEVIAAPARSALVVAGAGAGKTETMAARVVWLVATGQVLPEQVLGLTFTRKAAQQLGVRVRTRLRRLAGSRLLDELDPTGARRAAVLAGEPTVATYHAYAGRLVGEHALRLPAEPGVAAARQHRCLAARPPGGQQLGGRPGRRPGARHRHRLRSRAGRRAGRAPRRAHGGPRPRRGARRAARRGTARVPDSGPSRRSATGGGSRRSGCGTRSCRWWRRSPPASGPSARSTSATSSRSPPGWPRSTPRSGSGARHLPGRAARRVPGHRPRPARAAAGAVRRGAGCARRARRSGGHRRRRPLPVDLRLARGERGQPRPVPHRLPRSGRGARRRVRPAHQLPQPAGGARAGQRRVRAAARGTRRRRGRRAARRPGHRRGRRAGRAAAGRGGRARLDGRRRRGAVAGRGGRRRRPAHVGGARAAPGRHGRRSPRRCGPAACRWRSWGWAACSTRPRCATWSARCAWWPIRSPDRPRCGCSPGPRWRLGVADLAALWARARELVPGPPSRPAPSTAAELALGALPGEHAEQAGLVDALDDPGEPGRYSPAGFARIRRLATELGWLRARASVPLTDLVADTERVLLLDAETAARPGPVGRAHLDAFADVVADFAAGAEVATLPALLDYLETAERAEDGFAPGRGRGGAGPRPGPHRARGEGPGVGGRGGAAPRRAGLPRPQDQRKLADRPGRAARPAARRRRGPARRSRCLAPGADRKLVEDALTAHDEALDDRRLVEERRLFYVALTRSERVLLASGHRWGADRRPAPAAVGVPGRGSRHRRGDGCGARRALGGGTGVRGREPGHRGAGHGRVAGRPARCAVGRRARRRRAGPRGPARADSGATPARRGRRPRGPSSCGRLPDRRGRRPRPSDRTIRRAGPPTSTCCSPSAPPPASAPVVALPAQLSVSQLVELAADPAALAARLRRPLPLPPNPHARRGTAFHAWLEQRFGAAQLLDLDELPGAADEGAASDDLLEELQEAFLASRWAEREPVEVEVPFETVIDGVAVRGRMDAVFADPDGGFTVVDWKTGALPEPARRAVAGRAARRVPAGLGGAGRVPAGAGAGGVPLRAPRRDAAPRRPARRATACARSCRPSRKPADRHAHERARPARQ